MDKGIINNQVEMDDNCHEAMTRKRGGECHKVNEMILLSSLVILGGKTLQYLNLVMSLQ